MTRVRVRRVGAGPVAGPVVAFVVATLAALAVFWSVDPLTDASGCADDGGFACLGVGLVVLVAVPLLATLVAGVALAVLGVPRAGLVVLLAVATALGVASAGLGDALLGVALALPGLAAAAWTWALRPGRGPVPAAGLTVALIVVAGAATLLRDAGSRQDLEDRYAAADAPLLLLADDDWRLVAVDPMPGSVRSLYDAAQDDAAQDDAAQDDSDGTAADGARPRLQIVVADPPTDFDPVGDCAGATTDVADAPGEVCRSVGRDLWEVRTGLAVSYLALRDDAVVGLSLLYPDQLDAAGATTLADGLRTVTAQEIVTALED